MITLTRKGLPKINGEARALPSSAGPEAVKAWGERAIARMFELEDTCAIDVGDRGQQLGPGPLARKLGVTKQRVSQELIGHEEALHHGLIAAGVREPVVNLRTAACAVVEGRTDEEVEAAIVRALAHASQGAPPCPPRPDRRLPERAAGQSGSADVGQQDATREVPDIIGGEP